MPSVGIDRYTGRVLIGWPRVLQSLGVILITELGERVERRDFGNVLPRLIDKPQNLDAVMDLYMAVVQAIRPRLVRGRQYGEPCFDVADVAVDFSQIAAPALRLSGTYYPEGHRGDFSVFETRIARFPVNRTGDQIFIEPR